MAGFEPSRNMYDMGMKPMMLRCLIRQYIPDDQHPLTFNHTFYELSKVVSVLRTHRLLSEPDIQSMDPKLINSWKSAVDDWVNRLLLLLSSDMSDKCWVGICLLGVTCEECGSDRFWSSYPDWLERLIPHIQPPTDSQLLKAASCAAISDLCTRLARFPDMKKDGSSKKDKTSLLAGKLVQPVLKLLTDDGSESVLEGAANLLRTIITSFPVSIHPYYERAEAAIASKILSGKYSTKTLKKLCYCLALLPKSKGDEDSWCLMMQKILLSISDHLNDALQGFEEEAKAVEARRLLVPPGKDLPPPLGHMTLDCTSHKAATRSLERLHASSISTLIFCCCEMLTSSYPTQVMAPVRAILAVLERLLMIDGSLPHTMLPFMTAMQQELICIELPTMHAYSLELLIAIIKRMRSQLLPHAAYIVRLITRYFGTFSLQELRIKLYSITRILLISMGVGMAIYLAPVVIDNAFKDLNPVDEDAETSPSSVGPSIGPVTQPNSRKRKHGSKTGYLEEKQDTISSQVKAPNTHQTTQITVKIAAIDTLEVLVTVGGASKSESWRSRADSLLIKTARNSIKGGWGNEENDIFMPHESASIWADYQLSSLRALLASFLAPARVRPPYLAQGLELFRKGKQEAGTKLAGFCAHAMLALEVLIHPRTLPLDDFPSVQHNSTDGVSHRFLENMNSVDRNQNTLFSNSMRGRKQKPVDSDDGDDLYDRWIQDENENISVDNTKDTTPRSNLAEKPYVNYSSVANAVEASKQEPAAASAYKNMISKDEIMVQPWQYQESILQSRESVSTEAVVSHAVDQNPIGIEKEYKMNSSAGDGLNMKNQDIGSGDGPLADDAFDNVHWNTNLTLLNAEKANAFKASYSDSSSDSFPSIVDADPDTDSD